MNAAQSTCSFMVEAGYSLELCAFCNRAAGNGDSSMAVKLRPITIALADFHRAQERSIFSQQRFIIQGVAGNSMRGFTELTE